MNLKYLWHLELTCDRVASKETISVFLWNPGVWQARRQPELMGLSHSFRSVLALLRHNTLSHWLPEGMFREYMQKLSV